MWKGGGMDILQKILDEQISEIPRLILGKHLERKLLESGVDPERAMVDALVAHIFDGKEELFTWDDKKDFNVSITFSAEELAEVEVACDHFLNEKLPKLINSLSKKIAKETLSSLGEKWKNEKMNISLNRRIYFISKKILREDGEKDCPCYGCCSRFQENLGPKLWSQIPSMSLF